MKIIGIDPSSYRLGFCIANGITEPDHDLDLIDYGYIEYDTHITIEEKLVEMFDGVSDICKKHQPEIVGVEDVFLFQKYSFTALKLNMVKTAAMLGAYKACESKPEMFLIHSTTAKKWMGSGRASKDMVAEAVSAKFDVDITDMPYDITDAIAVAYAALMKSLGH